MNMQKLHHKFLAGVTAVMLALVMGAGVSAVTVHAASGTVYTCSIVPSYRHPVTGTIEDSGGEGSYATGQGMVEGCVSTTGMLEVTDSGEYYLTFRMGLMDYTTNHSFQVQSAGDSGWSTPSMGITGNGSDSNGTTADICIQVPSQNCVVRGSMYVSPMGRDVIFYLYPSSFSEGNSSGMNATMVTEASAGSTGQTADTGAGTTGGTDTTGETAQSGTTTQTPAADGSTTTQSGNALTSSITGAASGESETADTDSELSGAQGLSLSTEDKSTSKKKSGGGTMSAVQLAAAITVSGIILITVGAVIVYYYRKNWRRWGGDDDDED